jgi:hypothetical protein
MKLLEELDADDLFGDADEDESRKYCI